MKLSVIIPTYQEEDTIGPLLKHLQQHVSTGTELIVADGGSSDATRCIAEEHGVRVLTCARKGRARQMNTGAAASTGDILYFLHADTYPPPDFEQQLMVAVKQGYGSGCFRLRFDLSHWFLSLNAWFTRFDVDAVRFGDQSLFVRRDIFEQVGGFDERLLLLEDQEVVGRLRKLARFIVLPQQVVTSARKYKQVGVYRLQAGYFLIYGLYRLGASQQRLVRVYKWLL
ncbi:rSAM/selenodomain-associated transferase 2 [Pontibacter ummariensis]|uniref:Transferase 2, rSAM/selenodomain-associated n=1 Tax=Pontibacter ummariensis TaxID=1610492 RepID=A0A239BE25_9BACT|nr:TIGR04283 family arsenosugar biosynthesis glycosyltransferase [Pontibacter ummariensis]PRY16495.1 rSAM/selenodomain-associated transferase 2 [Pontibacter ummariensis]SNS06190.1 transferase 2, rSAM/selenodomain-associated [Pontibacter ummariensis]